MDDMVLWHDDKTVLKKWRDLIAQFIDTELLCSLKPEQLNFTSCGLPFLGYQIFPKKIRLMQQSKQRFIRKANNVETQYQRGKWSEAKCQRHILPLLAFIKHADTEGFRKGLFVNKKQKGQSSRV